MVKFLPLCDPQLQLPWKPIRSTENELMTVSWKSHDLPLNFVSSHVCTWQNTTCLHKTVTWSHAQSAHHVKRATLDIITWLPACVVKSWGGKAKFDLYLITCTPRDKIHVVYRTCKPLRYSQIRSFKIPTIHSPISTSLRNKTSLNIVFTQFRTFLSHQNAHQNKIYSLNTTTDFCVASAKHVLCFWLFLTVCSMTSHARLAQVTQWHDLF